MSSINLKTPKSTYPLSKILTLTPTKYKKMPFFPSSMEISGKMHTQITPFPISQNFTWIFKMKISNSFLIFTISISENILQLETILFSKRNTKNSSNFDIYTLLSITHANHIICPKYLHFLYFRANSGQWTINSSTIGLNILPLRDRSSTLHQLSKNISFILDILSSFRRKKM